MEQKQTYKENTSGKVRVESDIIFWDYEDETVLRLNANDICIVGEYTNSEGPWFDDFFLVFVTKDGQWQSIPWYAENINEVTQLLSDKFQTDLNNTSLANSTDWKSLIKYPLHLKDKPLFKLTPVDGYKELKTVLSKFLYHGLGFGNFDTTKNIELTDEVKQEINKISK